MMRWGRKFALLMLATVVLWTALPASACLLAMQPGTPPACCRRSMAQKCGMRGTDSKASCCQTGSIDAAVTLVPPFSPEHSLKPLLVACPSSLERSATPVAGWRNALEAPPPRSSAGAISILRI
jgi:hypothetical protein